jgi:hypothetical protein
MTKLYLRKLKQIVLAMGDVEYSNVRIQCFVYNEEAYEKVRIFLTEKITDGQMDNLGMSRDELVHKGKCMNWCKTQFIFQHLNCACIQPCMYHRERVRKTGGNIPSAGVRHVRRLRLRTRQWY